MARSLCRSARETHVLFPQHRRQVGDAGRVMARTARPRGLWRMKNAACAAVITAGSSTWTHCVAMSSEPEGSPLPASQTPRYPVPRMGGFVLACGRVKRGRARKLELPACARASRTRHCDPIRSASRPWAQIYRRARLIAPIRRRAHRHGACAVKGAARRQKLVSARPRIVRPVCRRQTTPYGFFLIAAIANQMRIPRRHNTCASRIQIRALYLADPADDFLYM